MKDVIRPITVTDRMLRSLRMCHFGCGSDEFEFEFGDEFGLGRNMLLVVFCTTQLLLSNLALDNAVCVCDCDCFCF